MEIKEDLTEGRSFIGWLFWQTYAYPLLFIFGVSVSLFWLGDLLAPSVILVAIVFLLCLCYKTYKQLQKGESS